MKMAQLKHDHSTTTERVPSTTGTCTWAQLRWQWLRRLRRKRLQLFPFIFSIFDPNYFKNKPRWKMPNTGKNWPKRD